MQFDRLKRRDVVALLGGALIWPLAAQAREPSGGAETARRIGLDPRLTPARPDLAAQHLAGTVEAQRFVEGQTLEVAAAQAPLREAPSHDAPLLTEALKGERVAIYEMRDDGWAWGQLAADGYVGYMPGATLGAARAAATHKVAALRTFVYPGPSLKRPPAAILSFGSQLAVERMEGNYAVVAGGGYVPTLHLVPASALETDFVAVAERFVGTPYLWGGKTSIGMDCSAVVQIALAACGIPCPRDTDMQEQALGTALPSPHDIATLRRGDLMFWRGHVAIVRDATTLVHANATRHMAVAVESIAETIARIHDTGSEVTSVRRLPLPS
jgi:cell wall-associated NlpC family hydrolase